MDNLQELTINEMKETHGGLGFLATVAAGIIIGAAIEIMSDWENFENGLSGRPYDPNTN